MWNVAECCNAIQEERGRRGGEIKMAKKHFGNIFKLSSKRF